MTKSPKRCRALHYIALMQATWWRLAQKQTEASSVEKTDKVEDQKFKLNDFLLSCKVEPVGNKSWLEWSSASDSTKRRYLDCEADTIVAILEVDLSKKNASHLWERLQTSKLVNEKLNMVSSEKAYLETLVESYKIAGSWDTRRQILSIIAEGRATNQPANLSLGVRRFGIPLPVFTGFSMVVEALSHLSGKPAFVSKGVN